MTTTNESVRRFLDLSTIHLSAAAKAAVLSGPASSSPVEYGWWVWINEDLAEAKNIGIPEDLLVIFRKAKALGCDYVLFDCDAMILDDLPQFEEDWEAA